MFKKEKNWKCVRAKSKFKKKSLSVEIENDWLAKDIQFYASVSFSCMEIEAFGWLLQIRCYKIQL